MYLRGSLRYADKVVILTGGTSGIGEGCVRVFVENGAKVVFCAKQEEQKVGGELEDELSAKGPGVATFVPCDVTKEEDIKKLINTTVEKYGTIDCLINNAGTHPPHMPIDDFSAGDFRELFEFHVIGHFLTSKGALVAMTRALAIDEAVHGVRVNSFSPGNIWTPLWNRCANETEDPQGTIETGKKAQLLGRMGTPKEVGQLCLFMASEATFLTGSDILLSGGAEFDFGLKARTTTQTT